MNAAQYRKAQDKALQSLTRRLKAWFSVNGAPATEAQIAELARNMLKSMGSARQRNYAVAVAYLASQGIDDPPELRAYGGAEALTKAITAALENFTVLGDPVTQGNRHDVLIVEKVRNRVERTVSRHAQAPARDTVETVANSIDGAAWARVLTGPTSCGFCAMLASRGPIYSSEYIALHRGGVSAKTYHDGCDCVAELVLDYDKWQARHAYEQLETLWQETTTKKSGKAARNAFRRDWDRKVRRSETGDYVADTMK